jgi:hypothetical protein
MGEWGEKGKSSRSIGKVKGWQGKSRSRRRLRRAGV